MSSVSFAGLKKKKFNKGNGLMDRAVSRFHQRGITRDDEDYKSSGDPQMEGIMVGPSDGASLLEGDDFLSKILGGPIELGNEFGQIITGEMSTSAIDNTLLLPSVINVGATGFIINAVSDRQPTMGFGYGISFGLQFLYGILFRK